MCGKLHQEREITAGGAGRNEGTYKKGGLLALDLAEKDEAEKPLQASTKVSPVAKCTE